MGEFSFELLKEVTRNLSEGFLTNCKLFLFTLLFALPLGLVICFMSMSKFKPLKYITKTLIWVVRGVPLLLQVFIAIYLIPMLLKNFGIVPIRELEFSLFDFEIMTLDIKLVWSIVAFSLNYACYFAEIYRGGIESVSYGQYEAGQVLGMTKTQVFFKVVLMQVVKRVLAPMSNEVITLVKDTALIRAASIVEILDKAEDYASTANAIFWPLFYSGAFFLIFVGILTLLFGYFEKKLSYYKI